MHRTAFNDSILSIETNNLCGHGSTSWKGLFSEVVCGEEGCRIDQVSCGLLHNFSRHPTISGCIDTTNQSVDSRSRQCGGISQGASCGLACGGESQGILGLGKKGQSSSENKASHDYKENY
eukprot:Protomagalhaensia_wolfi_Nauph_80__1848@NODE_2154_length_1194_cov_158_341126_g1684_i0_p3_GENE_NODE_2154_length_1194_cov_158_341126_g1684_i0NODE_2154_length_1194_cov_158_341126_g1684_i0_p3_ORF_typecomplete_len121_score6_10RCC1/PF00415_18/3_4RCC1/PF00415_18/15_NODE_2154_length_1194_cov_158_341126_g1684_i0504866